MSMFAIFYLATGVIFGAFLITAPPVSGGWYTVAQVGVGICSTAFLGAMLIGRRIKFDPVLR